MSDMGENRSRPKLFRLGGQLPKGRDSRTMRPTGIGVVPMYDPVEGID